MQQPFSTNTETAILEVGFDSAFYIENGSPRIIVPIIEAVLAEGPKSADAFVSKFNKIAGKLILVPFKIAKKKELNDNQVIHSFCSGYLPGQRSVYESRYKSSGRPGWIYSIFLSNGGYRVDPTRDQISKFSGYHKVHLVKSRISTCKSNTSKR